MAVRRLPAAVLVLGAVCAAGRADDPPVLPVPPPAFAEMPPVVLSAPPAPTSPVGPAVPPAFLVHPTGPDNCDGECAPCRTAWVDAAFFAGKAENLSYVHRKLLYGFDVDAGYWLTPDRSLGVELELFSAHGSYRDLRPGPLLVDSPVTLTTGDVGVRANLLCDGGLRVDGLAGYRYAWFHEKYLLANPYVAVQQAAQNQVHAGQIGAVIESRYGSYIAQVMGKVGFGYNSERVTRPDGTLDRGVICVIPELSAKWSYELGEGVWTTIGYRAVYLSNVYRPGKGDADYFLHGLTIGFEKRF